MIDTIYKVLLTIMNKENQGYISPEEFNLLAINVQNEIFRGYFNDSNSAQNKENRGLTNRGYGNQSAQSKADISRFATDDDLTVTAGIATLPTNLYKIEDRGVSTDGGVLVEVVDRNDIVTLLRTEVAPTVLYPVFEYRGDDTIKVYPTTITDINVRYIRKPLDPKWTYTIVANKELYDPNNGSFQDFELDYSEFSNIVLRMLSFFGINLREAEVVQVAEGLKDKMNLKDSQ